MSARDDGGPAFPTRKVVNLGSGATRIELTDGMSLRDHFAGLAFTAVIRSLHGPVVCEEAKGDFDRYAEAAYAMADAMLKARQS